MFLPLLSFLIFCKTFEETPKKEIFTEGNEGNKGEKKNFKKKREEILQKETKQTKDRPKDGNFGFIGLFVSFLCSLVSFCEKKVHAPLIRKG